MTARNFFLSLVLSLTLTLVVTVLYVFFPIIWLIVVGFLRSVFSSNTHTDSIGAVAGGVSESLMLFVVVLASALFLIIFTFLQRRSRRT